MVQDRKLLVARTKGKSAFFTPGGKREPGETDHAALIRECREELTVEIDAQSIQPYGVFEAQAFGKPEGTMVRTTCYTAEYSGRLQPHQEIEELCWVDSAGLTGECDGVSRELLTVSGLLILDDLKAKGLID